MSIENQAERAAEVRQALNPKERRWATTQIARLIAHVRTPLNRNGYALILSALSTSGLGIVYWAAAARFYNADNVGLSSAAISGMMLLSGIAQLNLSGALMRFLPTAGNAVGTFVRRAYGASLVTGLVLGAGFLVLQSVWSPISGLFGGNVAFLLWFVVAMLAWNVFALQDFVLTGMRQAKWVPLENIIFGLVKLALLVALAAPIPRFGIFLSWTIPTLGAIIAMNALIFWRLIPAQAAEKSARTEPILPRKLINFVAGNYLGFLFFLMSGMLLPIMVEIENGAQAAAYFYLAWIIAYSFQLISLNMTASLTVEASLDQERLMEYSYRVLKNIARLVVPLVVICVVGAPVILNIFGTGYSSNGADALRLLALAAVPNIALVVYVTVLRVQQRNVAVAVVQGAVCAISLVLSAIFLKTFGIAGVGLASLITQTALVGVLFVMRRSLFTGRRVTGAADVSTVRSHTASTEGQGV